MTRTRTIDILRRLRDGVDPRDGRPLTPDHVCQSGEVVRALFEAVAALTAAEAADGRRSRRSGRAAEIAATAEAAPDDETMEVVVKESRARPRPANAGQPWSEDDDRRLAEAFDGGADVAELMEAFGRTRSSIRARLILLGRGDLLPPGPVPRYPILSPVLEETAEERSGEEPDPEQDAESASAGGPFSRGEPVSV